MNQTIKKYTDLGVLPEKMVYSESPSICIWSITRKCLVGGNAKYPAEELVKEGKNYRVTYENNRMVSLQVNTTVDIDKINKSEGIIVTDYEPHFRYSFIPTK